MVNVNNQIDISAPFRHAYIQLHIKIWFITAPLPINDILVKMS